MLMYLYVYVNLTTLFFSFSGTPTDIVPRQLKCIFEAGDDSKMLRVLTSPDTITHEVRNFFLILKKKKRKKRKKEIYK